MRVQVSAWCLGAAFVYAAVAFAQTPQEAVAPRAGNADAGAELFSATCEACHASGVGPSLRGVIGRPIASVASFYGYTDALKAKSSDKWTEAGLDGLLADSQAFAPGSAMTVVMPDAQERADVIAYLASLPPPRQ